MGTGPIPATRKALARAGWKADDLDLIEANEAFAAQALAVNKDLGWDTDKVNVNGGAIAIGHPIGASGARVLITLLHEMRKRDAKKGLATLCIGGGMGVAMCVETVAAMVKRLRHLTIVVRDSKRAKAFFALLGFKEATSTVIKKLGSADYMGVPASRPNTSRWCWRTPRRATRSNCCVTSIRRCCRTHTFATSTSSACKSV